jgi:hypothetical protein
MRLLHRRHDTETPEVAGTESPVCEHVTLVPKWDRADKIGRTDEASSFRCEACGAEFTPSDAVRLRATEAARIQQRIGN